MVVKSATKKKLMDLGIAEEYAHRLADDRKWDDVKVLAAGEIAQICATDSGMAQKISEVIQSTSFEKMKDMDKSLATTFFDPQDARRWIAEGYRMMNVGTVLQLGTDRTKEIFSDLRAEFS